MSQLVIKIIKFYQYFISPMLAPSCRFTPSCSQYAVEAYMKHGFFHGTRLSIWRILRCNPWCKGGFEPVP